MKQHPLSAAFPAMSSRDSAALLADLEKNGQLDPITSFEGMVLDGWHRFQAMEELGLKPHIEPLLPNADPVAFVLSRNLHRRHMDASQRAVAVVSCREWKPTVGRPKEYRPGTVIPSTVPQMAKEADVSAATIERAKIAVKTGRADEVKRGELSVKQAARDAAPPRPKAPPEPNNEEPDMLQELQSAQSDIARLTKLSESLAKSDLAKEVKIWAGKFDAVNGRVQQMLTTESELKKTATYQEGLLKAIRNYLGVDKNSQILAALKEKIP